MRCLQKVKRFLLPSLSVLWLAACSSHHKHLASSENNKSATSDSKLILFLVSDQFSYEYLERLKHLWKGGIKTLLTNGANFTEAFHAHAATETCPGHASLITGSHPSQSGIIANNWHDKTSGAEIYCVEDKRFKVSPANLRVHSLGDWMKSKNAESKVYSISAKDRAAVIMGGHRANAAYWYNKKNGEMVTNSYYPEHSEEWVGEFNKMKFLAKSFGKPWKSTLRNPADLKMAGVQQLKTSPALPEPLGGLNPLPTNAYYSEVYSTPRVDELVGAFSEKLLVHEELGKDSAPDLMAVSFSAVDTVGHKYGPHSLQQIENLIRLDKTIDRLLKAVDSEVGLEHTTIVFSADHGVQAYPEVNKKLGIQQAKRVDWQDYQCIQNVTRNLQVKDVFIAPWYLKEQYRTKGIIDEIKKELEKCESVQHVWTADELTEETDTDEFNTLFKHSYHPERSPDFMIQTKEFFLATDHGTNHGTPYSYDAQVPVIIMGANIQPGEIKTPIKTVDIAPLLAELQQIKFQRKSNKTKKLKEIILKR